MAQVRFDRGQAARDDVRRGGDLRRQVRRLRAVEQCVQVAGVPPQGHGQRLQGARTPSPLLRVVLQFAHDRLRYVRLRGEVSLSQAEFAQPTVHRLGDGRPVRSRHRFSILPRGPPCGAEASRTGRLLGALSPHSSAFRTVLPQCALISAQSELKYRENGYTQ